MRPLRVAACLLVAAAGCGPDLPPPVEPAEAGTALRAALDAWRAGEPYESLAAQDPPIVFTEPLWRDGARLVNYELGEVELHGRQGRCTARLTLETRGGKSAERRIGYQIDTTPRIVIVREGLGP